MKISKNVLLSIGIVLLTSVNTDVLLASTSVSDSTITDKKADITEAQSSNPEIIEILPEDFQPAFTRDTVIKLNAIVKRSYAVIEAFDTFRSELYDSEQGGKENVKTKLTDNQTLAINALELHSHFALNDMQEAVKELKTSNEHYNIAVLAGMVMFVEAVDREVQLFSQQQNAGSQRY